MTHVLGWYFLSGVIFGEFGFVIRFWNKSTFYCRRWYDCICNSCEACFYSQPFHSAGLFMVTEKETKQQENKMEKNVKFFSFFFIIPFLWFIYSRLNGVSEALVRCVLPDERRKKNYTISAIFCFLAVWIFEQRAKSSRSSRLWISNGCASVIGVCECRLSDMAYG